MLGFFVSKITGIIMTTYRDRVFITTLGLTLISCILNPYHLLPGFDLFHNLFVAIILSLGLGLFFLTRPTLSLPFSSYTWLGLFVVVLIQPFINNIPYMDSLVVPLGALAITILLSIAVTGLDDKVAVIEWFLKVLIACMLVTFFIQLTQLYGIALHIGSVALTSIASGRIDGNLLQPNQVAFMYALSIVALIYFYNNNPVRYIRLIILGLLALFSLGVALTLSRAGLIMCVGAILAYAIFYKESLKIKLKNTAVFSVGFLTGYYLGVYLYKSIKVVTADGPISAVQRFSEGSLYMRESLQIQAWNLFTNSPLTGAGWGNFGAKGVEQATDLGWFAFSSHSHFFLSQIASELGLIGLLVLMPISWVVIKNLKLNKSNFDALIYLFIGVFLVYSCSEFPLWYLRFLCIFAIFVSLLDNKRTLINPNKNILLTMVSIALLIGSIFYWYQFLNVYKTFQRLGDKSLTDTQITELYDNFSVPFGYSNFKELLLFRFMALNANDIDNKIALGNRVISTEIDKLLLFRQAQLWAIKGDSEQSLALFKASCALHWIGECDNVGENLEELAIKSPEVYEEIDYNFKNWVKDFNPIEGR